MESDSEHSDKNSSSSMHSTRQTHDSTRQTPNQSDADESMIITKKKRVRKPIWNSDSESESEQTKSKSKSETENESTEDEDTPNKRYSKVQFTSDDEENASDNKENASDDEENASDDEELDEESTDDHSANDSNEENENGTTSGTSLLDRSARSDKTKRNSSNANKTKSDLSGFDEHQSFRSVNETAASLPQTSPSLESSEVIPETDDDDNEDNENESDDDVVDKSERHDMHVFSPRTRRSITGRRSMKTQRIESDEDEIFTNDRHSDNVDENESIYETAGTMKLDETSDAIEARHSDKFKRNRSIAPNDSMTINTPKAKRFSLNSANASSTPSRSTPDIEFSDKSNESKTSDIQIQSSHSENEMKSVLHDASIVLLNSSDEENHAPIANTSKYFNGIGSTTPAVKLVQPKLEFGKASSMKTTKKFVSRNYYNEKADALAKAKLELKDSENLYQQLSSTLPDKGANLSRRINQMKNEVRTKENELATYAIEEDNLDEVMIIEAANTQQAKSLNWRDELESIQPRHTGQQGMSTFNTQKTLTLNRIEKLHKAMDKCPTENELAKQPDNLNVQLMPHQLHAIKWMRWREAQSPKGGILADDMGLGKTLTVIGLVLDAKYRKNHSLAEEENEGDSTDSDDTDDSFDENDRGYKKSYSNNGGTLIVCPASLINQWESEIENRVKRRKLTILMHHGNKRNESIHSICKYDLVITTYGVVSSDHKNNGAIFRIRWNRIVLDEAHMIRNHSTAVSKGCCSLRATMRWGLTGTPIQNKHMDVYSMLKFLRCRPFDDLATFKKWIDPKTQAGMSRLHNVLKPLLLRRTKAELQIKGELQALPQKNMNIEQIELTPAEADVYMKILAYSQDLFSQYMEQHLNRNGGTHMELGPEIRRRLETIKRFGRGQEVKSSQILVLLLRMRQICDHPGLIHQMLQDECDLEDCDEDEIDSVDMNIVKQMVGLKINEGNDDDDDDDKGSFGATKTKSGNVLAKTNSVYDFAQPSSKCKRVIDIVKRILCETHDKIVVVSQWTTFLSIVADFLNRERVHYVELTGKTAIKDRNNIVVSFNNPNSPERVMMLSLVAGGVGLNLTGANHLILLDPHWNPQLESQAFDRIYRVGQCKDVQIYKLVCLNTVEEKIHLIQDSKLALSDNVLTGSKSSGSKLSMQDMRRLFDMF